MGAGQEPYSPDPLDHAIIAALRLDPRASNRSLSAAMSVSEATIAGRITLLRDLRIMDRVLQVDLRRLSLDCFALVDIRTEARPPEEIAAELATLVALNNIAVVAGNPTLCAQASVQDQQSLLRLIDDKIATVDGVVRVETSLVLEICKFDASNGGFSVNSAMDEGCLEAWSEADELDRAIVLLLKRDANLSNREVGRRLGVSERTIRLLLKRMFDAGDVHLSVVTDPGYFGRAEVAFLKIKAPSATLPGILNALRRQEACMFLGRTIGRWDLIALLAAASTADLQAIIRQQLDLDRSGCTYQAQEVITVCKHRVDLVAIPATRVDGHPLNSQLMNGVDGQPSSDREPRPQP
jgi:Lrp/AsnC family transcriptional regulator for asnA, asnC and gidA